MSRCIKLALICGAFGIAAFAAPASAQLVDNGNGTVTVSSASAGGTAVLNFNGNSGNTPIDGLTAQLTLNYLGLVGNDLRFSYSLFNNSTVDSRVSGFGFNTNPDVIGGTASGEFTKLLVDGSYPNGVGNIGVCLNDGGNACQGGGNGGVDDGWTGTGFFNLDFGASAPATVTLSNFADRYQSLAVGTGSGTGRVVAAVPEPSTWAMMLFGFGGIGFSMRRRRSTTSRLLQIA